MMMRQSISVFVFVGEIDILIREKYTPKMFLQTVYGSAYSESHELNHFGYGFLSHG